MSNSETEITNLVYRYAELMDSGNLEATAELFRNARIKCQGALLDSDGILELWRRMVKIYPCGSPRTKHVVTNLIIEVDETANKASCRCYYTLLQATEALALQVIAAGRYHDEFELADGKWRFSYRDYTLLDLKGDLSHHLNMSVPE